KVTRERSRRGEAHHRRRHGGLGRSRSGGCELQDGRRIQEARRDREARSRAKEPKQDTDRQRGGPGGGGEAGRQAAAKDRERDPDRSSSRYSAAVPNRETRLSRANAMSELLRLQNLFVGLVARLLVRIQSDGKLVTFGETWRTPEQAQWNADHGKGIS